jgi:preprotein translocase subunit SecF
MLVYLGFRFEWIYGIAAVVTVFHDTLITVGAFSLTEYRYYSDGDRGHSHPDWLL